MWNTYLPWDLSEVQICPRCSANQRQALAWLSHIFSIWLGAEPVNSLLVLNTLRDSSGMADVRCGATSFVGVLQARPAHHCTRELDPAKLKALVLGSWKEFNPWSTTKENLTKLYRCLSPGTFLGHYPWKPALMVGNVWYVSLRSLHWLIWMPLHARGDTGRTRT